MPRLPHRPRVLLIEDDPADAQILWKTLDRAVDAPKVEHGATLEAGLALLGSRPFDFVLLKIELPGGDAYEAVRRVRGAAEHTPVIVVSTHLDEDRNARSIEAGASDYLCKSRLTPDTLRRTLLYSWVRPRSRPGFRASDTMQIRMVVPNGGRSSEEGDPLSKVHPERIARIKRRYCRLFEPYFDSLVLKKPPPRNELQSIAEDLAELGAAPRDLMALHWSALQEVVRGLGPARQEGYSKEGRLLALEVMGYLAEQYRRQAGERWDGPG